MHWTTGSGNWETWMYGRQLDNWDYNFTWAKWITPSRDIINDFERKVMRFVRIRLSYIMPVPGATIIQLPTIRSCISYALHTITFMGSSS